nr:MAG TPA: hypothetical protein [Caudoviricetes sp.]
MLCERSSLKRSFAADFLIFILLLYLWELPHSHLYFST